MNTFKEVVETLLKDSIFFVQVGAYDGKTHDPIAEYIWNYGWTGIMIEPNLIPFAKLVDMYDNRTAPMVELLQVAITKQDQGLAYLHYVPGEGHWKHASASLCPEQTRLMEFESEVRSTLVRTRTLQSILDERAIEQVDLLQIDAEGMDLEVMMSLDFDKIQPGVIHFEERWIPLDTCVDYLHRRGYVVFTEPNKRDSTAFNINYWRSK